MTYERRPRGFGDDVPITQPAQVDDDLRIVGTVTPRRVECSALPADSPWRRTGQVCEPSMVRDFFGSIVDSLFPGATQPIPPGEPVPSPPAPAGIDYKIPLLIAAAGGLGYYLLTRKKRA
jgi:hypothetical protein